MDDQEQTLIRRALDDPQAFQQLYERYFRRIYGYVAARIANSHDAEDVVSEIFLKVIKNLAQLRSPQHISFAAWLFVIARNAVTDYYRREAHAQPVVSFDSAPPVVVETDSDSHIIAGEEAAHLRERIAALSDRKREVIELKYYGGLRNQEIAVVLQVGEKTVAAYLSRALDELYAQYTALESESRQKVTGHDS